MSYDTILSLLTLIALQNVLGTDNDVFISLISEKLAPKNRKLLRVIGIISAACLRIGLLLAVNILLNADRTLFSVNDYSFSTKNIILSAGGIFLIYISTREIYRTMEPARRKPRKNNTASMLNVLTQVMLINVLLSVESVITAIGVAEETWVQYAGVCAGIVLMIILSVNVNKILLAHPSLKALSFCFLFLIGFSLICEAMEIDVPKTYIYFIMVFAIIIDVLQIKLRRRKITTAH